MAIEFRCTNCGKLLRTGDDTAGRQAKCPECGTVMTIPAAASSGPLPQPPPPSGVDPAPSLQPPGQPARDITPSTLDLGEVFSRTWTIFKPNWGSCLVVVVLVWSMGFGVNLMSGLIPIVGSLIAMVFQTWIGIGMALYFLKTARGQKVEIGEIFTGWPYFLKILLAAILLMLIVLGIFVICALPSLIALLISKEAALILLIVGAAVAFLVIVYVMLVISQYYYLILDRDVDVIESFMMSRDLMKGNKLTLFVIGLLCGLIAIVAMLPLFLGLLVAVPFFALMYPVIYLTITGQPMADPTQGKPTA
ncbi:MAG: DUF975 family protein [Planctomycetes bacterium]|nr:DUF975 family protein [Planctomycetota bacterium]MBU4398450.1 DUF975 family protein [Planctomycetota bacterium]MCG2682208.1 DUF975 family protein [Planctomycetales bacterium]